MDLAALRNEAATIQAETAAVDFKDRFDRNSQGDWCELIKDILAMANSGGGCILFGLKSDGTYAGIEPCGFAEIDPADVTNKVSSYLYKQFTGFELTSFERDGRKYPTIRIDPVTTPLLPRSIGNYVNANGKTVSAFHQGMAYFRHGAKSEPAEQADLDRMVTSAEERGLRRIEEIFMKLKDAPAGATLQVLPAGVQVSMPGPSDHVRITSDPAAEGVRYIDCDHRYPHLLKDVVDGINTRVGRVVVTTSKLVDVRRAFDLDTNRTDLIKKRRHGSFQYSPLFIDWVCDEILKDPQWITKAHAEAARRRSTGRFHGLQRAAGAAPGA